MFYVIIGIFIVLLFLVLANVRLVSQSEAKVIERLGAYASTWGVGIHVKLPFIDRIANTVSLKEKVLIFHRSL